MQARFLSFAVAALLCTGLALAKVNVNTATLEELDTLYGIGEARAKAIVEYRQKNGDFRSLRDLKKVPELPDSVVEGLKGRVSFSGPTKIESPDGDAAKEHVKKEPSAKTEKAASGAGKSMSLPSPVARDAELVAPARPVAPAKPAAPSQPPARPAVATEKPAGPAVPASPAKPSFEGKPSAPATSAPAKPAAPAMPGVPAKPAAPAAKPAAHATEPVASPSGKPAAPAAPARPATPARPAAPPSY